MLIHGGWLGLGRYDDGVYLGMSMSLLHGQLPYRDLVMLHPPGVVLALAPFAAIAGPFGDPVALVLGKVVVMLAGGVTAALVAWLVRGPGTVAMWAAGGTYAVFVPAAYADSSLTLEAVSNLLLAAALALSVGVRRPQVWQLWSAGCPAGRGDRDQDLGCGAAAGHCRVLVAPRRAGRRGQGRVELLTI